VSAGCFVAKALAPQTASAYKNHIAGFVRRRHLQKPPALITGEKLAATKE